MDVEESEVAIKHLKEIQEKIGDVEIAHVMADDVLCELLIRLGYSEVVKQYTNIDKWYA